MSGKSRFPNLLSEYQIKQVKLKNRIVKTSAAMGLASDDGFITDENIGFYEARAKGGVGLIIVEHGFVDYPMGVTGPRRIAINDDKYISGLKKLVQIMHKHNTPCFQQLGHCGPAQKWLLKTDQLPVSSTSEKNVSRGLTIDDIKELVEKYVQAALRAQEIGYDGIEVHAAAGYLINSFFSLSRNRRTDMYGPSSLQSRSLLLVEILQAIRKQVGNDFPVGTRINVAEYGIENGTTAEDARTFAKILQDAGADFIIMQLLGAMPYDLLGFPEQIQYPEPIVDLARTVTRPGVMTPFAAAIKKVVTVPVITVGRLDAKLGEWILKHKMADLIGMNRRLFADAEYPNKVKIGRLEDIAPCTACMECWASQQLGNQIVCRINAELGREYEMEIKPAEKKKKVVIVGGGLAGIEVARVAAIRGHDVILYEKRNKLGGLLPLAALIKGTLIEDLPGMVSYLKVQLKKLGVLVKLGTEVRIEDIIEMKPDVVVIATGGLLTVPNIPGINTHKVVTSSYLHQAVQPFLRFPGTSAMQWLTKFYMPIGKRVVIIGGLMQGCELAEFLVKRRRKVTVVEETEKLGTGIHEINRPRLLRWLISKGVTMLAGVQYQEITSKGLAIVTRDGEKKILEADTILIATPPVANNSLYNALKGRFNELYQVGDSKAPGTIVSSIGNGSQIGRVI